MIDKTLAYYNSLSGQSSPFGEWKMKLDFVVDDNNEGGSPFHTVMNNSLVIYLNNQDSWNLKNIMSRSCIWMLFSPKYIRRTKISTGNQAISNDIGNSLYFSISDMEESMAGHRKEY
jgi:hypothetical protein